MGKKNYAVIILVLLIVVAVFAGYKYATDLKQEAKTHDTKIVITPEITRSNIQRGDMYLLPDTLSEEPNPATLPEALKPLIIKEASTTLVKKVEYPDNK